MTGAGGGPMVIAVDGPSASGKGTVARQLARHYGLPHLDTGLLYRAVGMALPRSGAAPDDAAAAAAIARALDPSGFDEHALRSAQAGAAAAAVAAMPAVRRALLDLQRGFAAQPGGAVLDGRDIGTVICPDAAAKLWVTASAQERARRRWRELEARGEPIPYEQVLAQLAERDARDAGRKDAPAKPAEDAVLLDTTHLGIDAAFAEARRIVDAALQGRGA
jgi:cytidylate kinase